MNEVPINQEQQSKALDQPYVGPRPYERDNEKYFSGRDGELADLSALISSNSTVLLYAQSGAGKTSLINAGLIPLLEKKGDERGGTGRLPGVSYEVLPTARVRLPEEMCSSGERPRNIYVYAAICSMAGKSENLEDLRNTTLVDFLATCRSPDSQRTVAPSPRLLVFDQFEEMFATFPERMSERRAFFEQVALALVGTPISLTLDQILDSDALLGADQSPNSPLADEFRYKIAEILGLEDLSSFPKDQLGVLISVINGLIDSRFLSSLCREIGPEGLELIEEAGKPMRAPDELRLNRLLLELAFRGAIRTSACGDPNLRVLFSMREDYLGHVVPFRNILPGTFKATYRLTPLTSKSALTAIKRPAELAGRPFEPEVAEKLVQDLVTSDIPAATEPSGDSEYIDLLQLQIVCQKLWDDVVKNGEMSISADRLEKSGQVSEALRQHYVCGLEAVRDSVAAKNLGVTEGALRIWFSESMIDRNGSRVRATRGGSETQGLPNVLADDFYRRNLLRKETLGGTVTYEIPHDRFRKVVVDSNAAWFDKSKDSWDLLRHFEKRAEQHEIQAGALLGDSECLTAEALIRNCRQLGPSRLLENYVRESRRSLDDERKQRDADEIAARLKFVESEKAKAEAQARAEAATAREAQARAQLADEQVRAQEAASKEAEARHDAEDKAREAFNSKIVAEYQAKLAQRRAYLSRSLFVLTLSLIAVAYYAFSQQRIAENKGQIAAKKEAEANMAAQHETASALRAQLSATEEAAAADKASKLATLAKAEQKKAALAAVQANKERLVADQERRLANSSRDAAVRQRIDAIEAEKAAFDARGKALKAESQVRDSLVKQQKLYTTAQSQTKVAQEALKHASDEEALAKAANESLKTALNKARTSQIALIASKEELDKSNAKLLQSEASLMKSNSSLQEAIKNQSVARDKLFEHYAKTYDATRGLVTEGLHGVIARKLGDGSISVENTTQNLRADTDLIPIQIRHDIASFDTRSVDSSEISSVYVIGKTSFSRSSIHIWRPFQDYAGKTAGSTPSNPLHSNTTRLVVKDAKGKHLNAITVSKSGDYVGGLSDQWSTVWRSSDGRELFSFNGATSNSEIAISSKHGLHSAVDLFPNAVQHLNMAALSDANGVFIVPILDALPPNNKVTRKCANELARLSEGKYLIGAPNIRFLQFAEPVNDSAYLIAATGAGDVEILGNIQATIGFSRDHPSVAYNRDESFRKGLHLGGISALAVSADGRLFATAGFDQTLKISHVQSDDDPISVSITEPIEAIAFTQDGNSIVAATFSGLLYIIHWKTGDPTEGPHAIPDLRATGELPE